MTEAEWWAGSDVAAMLTFVWEKPVASSRRLQLFACAAVRRAWDVLNERGRQIIASCERCADGAKWSPPPKLSIPNPAVDEYAGTLASSAATDILFLSSYATHATWRESARKSMLRPAIKLAKWAAYAAARANVRPPIEQDFSVATGYNLRILRTAYGIERSSLDEAKSVEQQAQCDLLRDIFGNPFRDVRLEARWRDSRVRELARRIYDDRLFDLMPELAEALEEVGCEDVAILDHCRKSDVHVRGCWVVDLVLRKP